MASAEENVECRRTRSGRKVSTTQPTPTVRPNRRSTRKQTQDEQIELDSDTGCGEDKEKCDPIVADGDGTKELCEITRQESNNSTEDQTIYEEIGEQTEGRLMDAEMYAAHEDAEVPVSLDGGIDEKSSSFPFGVMGDGHSETSDDAQNDDEISGSENTAVENSLLASLAGDNANSLPSVGGGDGENEIKKNFDSKVIEASEEEEEGGKCEKLNSSDESISQPAIAEDLGDGETSNATIVNTELVSEDELPAQSKVNYTEEVSDEELPAPKRAELPPDAEVISEDELPPRKSPGNSPKRARSAVKINIYSTSTDVSSNTTAQKRKPTESDPSDDKADGDSKPEAKKVKSEEQYNPMSPTSESDDTATTTATPVEKRAKLESCESEDIEMKKEKEVVKEKEKKRLPDLEKYWRVVKEDPADFTGWTYLLQYVDNESDAEAAREAYDKFLSHYPYCYGYWRKYADYEKRKGIKANSNAVFERGLDAIPLSVDLWIHYLTHIKSNHSDNEAYIRSQFERATSACGLEFRSDKLWDAYIKWETDGKHYQRVLAIYDRLLSIPTHGYSGHFDSFQDFINQHEITSLIGSDELNSRIHEIRSHSRSKSNSRRGSKEGADPKDEADDDVQFVGDSNEDQESDSKEEEEQMEQKESRSGSVPPVDVGSLTDEELVALKEKVVAARRKLHKATVAAVTARWAFEEGIKRPYFHVKPLERSQLKNWNDYLDFEIEKGDRKRIIVLFERCLIACALYDEFWLKMIRYLETTLDEPGTAAITSDVFQRACEIHHPDKPSLHLMWAAFEECQSNFDRAATILVSLEKKCPNLLQVAYRRINVERRRGDFDKCKELYEHYIAHAKNKTIAGSLSIKYARFLNKICKDLNGGLKVLSSSLEKDPANTRVALQMIDLALQRDVVDEAEVVQIMDKFMARENMDPEQKVLFAQRKVEFLEDFGSTAQGLQDAQRALQLTLSKANEAKKKRESSPTRKMASNTKETTAALNSAGQAVLNNGAVGALNNTGYYGAANSAYYGQQNSGGYPQQTYDGYYNQWQYGSGYSGYGQWGGYGNYY